MDQHAKLERTLGLPAAILLGLGSILGTGVYLSLVDGALQAGQLILPAIASAGLLAMLNGLSSAQLAAAHPVSGGTYEYAYRLITPVAGFTAGWFFLGAKSASAATAAIGLASYLGLPALAAPILVLGVTALALFGLRRSTGVNAVLVILSLAALTVFVVTAFAVLPAGAADTALLPPYPGTTADPSRTLLAAAALAFVAFTGYGRVATLGEEVRNPQRTIPLAVLLTLLVTLLIYLGVATAALRIGGDSGLATAMAAGASPLAALLEQSGQSLGAVILRIGATVALLGVLLNLVLGLSRVVLAMGRRGDLPAALAHLGTAHDAPAPQRAILAVGFAIALIALTGNARLTWSVSAVTVLLYYGLTNLAALRLPAAQRSLPRAQSIAGLVGCLSLAAFVEPSALVIGLAWLASGLVVRGLVRLLGQSSSGTR